MYFKPFALSLMVACLAACGGGGDDDEEDEPEDESAAGIFTGTVTGSAAGSTATPAALIVTEDGRFILDAPPVFYVSGTGTTRGAGFDATGTGYRYPAGVLFASGNLTATVTLSGTVTERTRISGSFSTSGFSGTMNFPNYQTTVYERAASVAANAGVYQLLTGYNGSTPITSTAAVVSFTSAGVLSLNDSNNCVGSGTISAPFPSRNYYNWSMTLTGCTQTARNGTYTGLASMNPDPAGNYVAIIMSGTFGSQFLVFRGTR